MFTYFDIWHEIFLTFLKILIVRQRCLVNSFEDDSSSGSDILQVLKTKANERYLITLRNAVTYIQMFLEVVSYI